MYTKRMKPSISGQNIYTGKKSVLVAVAALILALTVLPGCADREEIQLPTVADYEPQAEEAPHTSLRVGVVPGPHADMFVDTIRPALEGMGYDVTIMYYGDYTFPNIALSRGQIDLNMYQHYSSLNDYKFENDLALSAIAEVPTLPMGIFSLTYDELAEVEDGVSVSIPADPSNRARALRVLEAAHLIRLDPYVDPRKLSEGDIIDNPHELVFVPLRVDNLVQSLAICEMTVIDSNYAISGGLKLSNELYAEIMDAAFLNVIAVRTDDLSARFVWDIIAVLGSDSYRGVIMAANGDYAHYQKPAAYFDGQ